MSISDRPLVAEGDAAGAPVVVPSVAPSSPSPAAVPLRRRVRTAAGRARQRLLRRLRTGGPLARTVYHGAVNDGIRRERRAVAAGHRAYHDQVARHDHAYLLRRNTHMLEKGLIMRPRRETFATAYIEETVAALAGCLTPPRGPLSDTELGWVREVLDQYFAATATSADPAICRARDDYAQALAAGAPPAGAGPEPPPTGPPPVAIDDLLALAERRKSVRWFLPRLVPRAAIDQAVRVAAEAPSACNRQPFTFRVYDDPELVAEVAAIPMGTNGYAHNIPAIVVIVGDLAAFSDERDRHLIYIDGCLAAMGFILGLEAQGIATCCINWPDIGARERRMRSTLGLAEHERPVMLVALGYADPDGSVPHSARRELTELRSYNRT